MNFFTWLLDRLQEKSTWYGVTALLTSAGVSLDPNLTNQIITAAVGVSGVIAVVAKEKK